jgi:signal transduction histidine kinase
LTVRHEASVVAQSPQQLAALEDVVVFRELVRLPELDLMLDVSLRQDAVHARWAMAWQWLVLIWAFVVLCLTLGVHLLNLALTRQVQTAASLKSEQEAAKVRSDFLANMSHELRTPLMGVLGAAELLEGASATDQNRYLRMIRDSGRHLLGLLNNVLDFSRLDAGAMPLEPQVIEPLALLEEVVQSFSPQAEFRQLTLYGELDLHSELSVKVDGFRLTQVLSNLIGNALKFTHQGWVRVQAGLAHDQPQARLWVRITDTGIGVSADQQARLFKPFSQADDSTSRRYGGTGLGLVIVQQLLNLMGGQIRFLSTEGLGTEVWLSVPVEVIRTGHVAEAFPGFCHLTVEDDLLRSAVSCHLKQLGVAFCSEPLTEVLEPTLRVVDEKSWKRLQPSVRQTPCPQWLVVVGAGVAPDIGGVKDQPVKSMHALQARSDWAALVQKCRQACEAQALAAHTTERSGAGDAARILVAEDNEMTREILARFLSGTSYQIDFAPDGKIALELWHQKAYDMAILDCHMPVIDGFSVAQEIRAKESPSRRVPLVALTAATLQEDVARCIQAGIDEVWPKPITKAQLLSNLERCLL